MKEIPVLINSALEAHKIARAKNNGEELLFFAKKVGSTYFLPERRLEFVPLRGFNALVAPAPAASAPLSLHDLRESWDNFRTASWIDIIDYPELTLKETQEVLALQYAQ